MRERVLVADLQSRYPPVFHVRLVAVGHVDVAPAAHAPLIVVIEVLDTMQIVKVPEGGRMLAVDLERVERLVPARMARGFERRERAVLRTARVSRRDRLEHGLPRQVEEDRRLPERVRVGPSHEPVPD